MPWKGKQAQAVFLQKQRELGTEGAREWMHRHGHPHKPAKRRRRKRRPPPRPY